MKLHAVEQNTPEWDLARLGKPTASAFSNLITSTGTPSKSLSGYAQDLAGELYAQQSLDTWNGNRYTEYGHETEQEARLAYAFDAPGEVVPGQFVTDDMEQYGASPDAFVGDAGLLEIKCLPKQHIKTLIYWKQYGKAPPEYMQQTQGQLFVCEREWVDLFFYRPFLPSLAIRIYRDEKFIAALKRQVEICIAERNIILNMLREF